MVQELINFSVYSEDTVRFNHDWQAVAAYTRGLPKIAGVELLLGYEPPPLVPEGLVKAVHLPFWVTWLDVWHDKPDALARYFPDVEAEHLIYYCGGSDPAALINTQRHLWLNAATLQPDYAVLHVSHVEVAHAFTRQYTYSNVDIIDAMADLLNATAATFDQGEPPVRLYLENLWWPGLTFTDGEAARRLAARLNFENWAFVLDTGHLMNNNPNLTSESQAIDYVLATVNRLPSTVRNRIEGLHLHFSLSGIYQKEKLQTGLPAGFEQLSVHEQRNLARLNAYQIDQHRPFTDPRCVDIVEALPLRYLTHEFLSATQTEYEAKLATQQTALHQDRLDRRF